jgi:hypothetical protein
MKLFFSFFLISVFSSEQALCKDASMNLRQRPDGNTNGKLPMMAANAMLRKLHSSSNSTSVDDTLLDDTTLVDPSVETSSSEDSLVKSRGGRGTKTSFTGDSVDSPDDSPDGRENSTSTYLVKPARTTSTALLHRPIAP